MWRRALFAAIVTTFTFAEDVQSQPEVPFIGSASMAMDGTITLQLFRTSDGQSAHALFTYKVGDPKYQETLAHIGGLKAGESKPVKPWPDR